MNLFTYNDCPPEEGEKILAQFITLLEDVPSDVKLLEEVDYDNLDPYLNVMNVELSFAKDILNGFPQDKKNAVINALVHLNRILFNQSEIMQKWNMHINEQGYLVTPSRNVPQGIVADICSRRHVIGVRLTC